MISGRIAFAGLELEFGSADARFDELSKKLERAAERQSRALDRESEILRRLAEIHLPELSPETVAAGLLELRARLRDALDEQRSQRVALRTELPAARDIAARHAARVAELESEETAAAERLEACRVAVEAELGSHPAHARQVREHRETMERLETLRRRRGRLASAGNLERRRYEADPAFAYLLERGYGEATYAARFVRRTVDRWLARRIDFETLRRNYRILTHGPRAVQEEIETLRRRAAELERILDEREAQAGAAAGLLRALEVGAGIQKRLASARDELASAQERVASLEAEERASAANHGQAYERALDLHEEYFRGQSYGQLIEHARATPDPRDGPLVRELQELRDEILRNGSELSELRQRMESAASRAGRVAELKRLTSRLFKSRRSYFPDHVGYTEVTRVLADGDSEVADVMEAIEAAHERQPLLQPASDALRGWFAELSSRFDHELEARRLERPEHDDADYLVIDAEGRVVHRRVTPRDRRD